MKYNTREDFIKSVGIRKLGLVEYIYKLEESGLSKHEILAELLKNKVSKSPRMLDHDWKFYIDIKPKVRWL